MDTKTAKKLETLSALLYAGVKGIVPGTVRSVQGLPPNDGIPFFTTFHVERGRVRKVVAFSHENKLRHFPHLLAHARIYIDSEMKKARAAKR